MTFWTLSAPSALPPTCWIVNTPGLSWALSSGWPSFGGGVGCAIAYPQASISTPAA